MHTPPLPSRSKPSWAEDLLAIIAACPPSARAPSAVDPEMLVKARAAASGGFDELLAFVKPNTLPAPEDAAARAADTAIALARATSHTRVAHRDAA